MFDQRKNYGSVEAVEKEDDFNPQVKLQKGVYALTITPDDSHQFDGHLERMKLFRDWMNSILLCLPQDNIDYYVHFELSEIMTNERKQTSRLHVHGMISFGTDKSVKKFWLHHQSRLNKVANYLIKPITDIDKWNKYLHKQQAIMDEAPLVSCVDIFSKINPKFELIKPVVKEPDPMILKDFVAAADADRKKAEKRKIKMSKAEKLEMEQRINDQFPELNPLDFK